MFASERVAKETSVTAAAHFVQAGHTDPQAQGQDGKELTKLFVKEITNPTALNAVADEAAKALSPDAQAKHLANVFSSMTPEQQAAMLAHLQAQQKADTNSPK